MSAASPVYVFTGENSWALRNERGAWTDEFIRKHGMENLLRLDASDVTYRSLLDEVGTAPFLSDKRLVIIRGLPNFEPEEIAALPSVMHPGSILLLWAEAPDKRTSATKAWLKHTVKEFPALQGTPLLSWMRQIAATHGAALPDGILRELVSLVGEDQETLSHEVEKAALFATAHKTITIEDIRALTLPSAEQEVWNLTNLIAAGKGTAALSYVRSMTERGEDAYALWSMLLWFTKNVVSVWAASSSGNTNPATIASEWKVPFPTARTLTSFVARKPKTWIRDCVTWAAETDVSLKTGEFRSTQDAQEELLCLIDRLILKLF